MDIDGLKVGTTIEGPKWTEPVVINKIDRIGDNINLIGSTAISSTHIDVILSNEEIQDLSFKTTQCDFSSEPWKVFLGLEAIRYKFASEYDPWLAMSTSKVDPLPHQIEAVYDVVLKLPRIRFLLAHDPGAGKTIMAGLIIKEMKLRHLINRILIVVPGHLKDQWKRELKDRFEENFIIANRSTVKSLYGQSIWEYQNHIITSIDFAKQADVITSLESSQFDLIIVDEAHKMAAYKYNDQINKTSRYKLGEILSKNTEHFLFLTATPHKGDAENFRLFLDLLQPGFFVTSDMLKESIKNNENTLFLRRIKEDMKSLDGTPLFLSRRVSTISYTLSILEMKLYKKITKYVKNQYNKVLESTNKRNIGFALIILQRRLASSSYALYQSLTRRQNKLKHMLKDSENIKKSKSLLVEFDKVDEIEDMSEEDRWKEETIWEALSIAENRDELEKEIQILNELIIEAKNVIDQNAEVKLKELERTIDKLNNINKPEKILIFTESKDTLEYLVERIKSWGYSTNYIHGGMDLDERIYAENFFKTNTQIMVATEAAGEGINLQFCHLMINYDIPWNPNRLEQRMGRIHRYGQKYQVSVFNLLAQDTIEGKIFKKLFEKLEEIKGKMGNDKVFDIIGGIYSDKDLASLLSDAAIGAKTEEEIFDTLDNIVDHNFIQKTKKNLEDTLATKHIDFTQINEQQQKARENRLIPEYTAEFFKKAFTKAEGKIKERNRNLYSIDSIPYLIRKIAEEDTFKKSYGSILKSYPKITFMKDVDSKDQDAEFLTFGHPLFEAILKWISQNFMSNLKIGAEFIDHSGHLDGNIIFYEGEIKDGLENVAGKRLFSYYIDSKSNLIEYIEPSILWDLEESSTFSGSVDIDFLKSKTQEQIIENLRTYKKELQIERNRQAEIKKKYGIESLSKLITNLDSDLLELNQRKQKGENVDLVIRNKENRQRQYIDNKKQLYNYIQQEKNLTIYTPSFLGIIKVSSPETIQDELRKDSVIEKNAMKTVLNYEISHGRKPKDVSKDIGIGYDIRSLDRDGNFRYIEVKGRKGKGVVALTKNEWFKAKHLGTDYYLYVIWNAEMYPNVDGPKIIKDPANNLNANANIHYLINPHEIEKKT